MALYTLQGSCRLESGSFVGVQRRLPSPTEPPLSHFTSINLGCDMSVSTVGGQRTLGRCFATDHLSIACKASNGPYQPCSSAFQSNGGAAQYSFAIPHGFTVKPGFSQEFGKGLSCKCSNSFGELGSAAILEWKPALDNLFLVSSIALAYIAGIITPATPAPSVPLKGPTCSGVEEFQALPNVQGERVEEAPLWKEDIWNGARSKLIKSIDAADAMCDEISGQGVQLSLQALARGPRLRLLLMALEQLKKEGNLSLVACKVFSSMTGELTLRRLFYIVGLRDGFLKVELFSKDSKNIGPEKLVWASKNELTLTLEANDLYEGILQRSAGLISSQQALQYLIHLVSPGSSSLVFEGHHDEESSVEQGHIARCLYSRLTVADATPEKELIGLWSGVYGPHGVEIINVTQTCEGISGIKVLGDSIIPCGQVTFRVNRADLCLETLEVPVELQQIVDLQLRTHLQQFNILKLYKGFGRTARHNFRNPLWVPGHLLVSKSGQIAFIWEDVNFVVPFKKLDLAAFYQSQEQLGKVL